MTINYDNIPDELKWDRQWVVAGPDENGKMRAPSMIGPHGIFKVKPTQNTHWKDFETVREMVEMNPQFGLGYILTKSDPYTCIDLDVKNANNEPDASKWTSVEAIERFDRIIAAFDSYTERSSSGQGYHIWVRGSIGEGVRRDGVEVYSQERFIVCTGDVFLARDIVERQELLNLLVQEIKAGSPDAAKKIELVEVEPTETDDAIFERARTAENAIKFVKLCNGEWVGEYPSQSEADLALMSIFTFYSKSNSQCRRLFRATKLGERDKSTKNDRHLDRMLSLIRTRQAKEDEKQAYAEASAAALLASVRNSAPATATAAPYSTQIQPYTPQSTSSTQNTPQSTALTTPPSKEEIQNAILAQPLMSPTQIAYMEEDLSEADFENNSTDDGEPTTRLEWPPGLVGQVARYIYHSSPRPVREVAIVGALGFFAGLCGKIFNIPQSGLNLYIVLVARSAIGKEAMHSGISSIVKACMSSAPAIAQYVDFTDYASGPALSKAVLANPCFVNVSGEWGRKLKRLAVEDGRDGPMQQLRTTMTNLYQKSGPGSIVGGIGYSDKEKNSGSVSGAAYSMIGETTPKTFYDALTEQMMEDGFLSRFTVIEYTGDRPAANPNLIEHIDPTLIQTINSIIDHVVRLTNEGATQPIGRTAEAAQLLDAFDKECDHEINRTQDEAWRQMWNRAHLKCCRIAGLLASADNHAAPVITLQHATWALDVIRRDIGVMGRRIISGDVGTGDVTRERKLLSILRKFLAAKKIPSTYNVSTKMHKDGIVPRKFLQMATSKSTAFINHRTGHNFALDITVKSLIDSGYIVEYPKDKSIANYDFHGRCFRVVQLPRERSYR